MTQDRCPLFLCLNVETRATPATALRARYARDLELAADQLHGIVNLAALQQFQTRLVHYHLGSLTVLGLEQRVLLVRNVVCRGKRHEVLKAVASAGLDGYA